VQIEEVLTAVSAYYAVLSVFAVWAQDLVAGAFPNPSLFFHFGYFRPVEE
jgi:hypothetical protein